MTQTAPHEPLAIAIDSPLAGVARLTLNRPEALNAFYLRDV